MADRGAVVISGASTGIGEATAMRLATSGYRVFAGVRKQADADRLRSQSLPNLVPIMLDVTDSETIEAAYKEVEAAVGDRGIVGLFNNAGVSWGGPLEFQDMAEVRALFDANVFGVLEVTQVFMPLVRKGHGRVICTGSIGGRITSPFVGIYSASKAAVASLCHALRLELRPWGIKVICIEPGSIATPIWDKGLDAFDRALANMPEKANEYYGDMIEPLRKLTKMQAERGIPPAKVAEVVERALTAAHPRPRYLVGNDARAMSLLGRFPDRARDAVLARFIGIPKVT
jgi:NAD(P)-dependent dehydrogenase (short-subunit alcohol dehydrogenase family)